MRYVLLLCALLSVLVIQSSAIPVPSPEPSTKDTVKTDDKGGGGGGDVLLLSGFAYPSGKGGYTGSINFFTFKERFHVPKVLKGIAKGIVGALKKIPGVSHVMNTLNDRISRVKDFIASPFSGGFKAHLGSVLVTLKGGLKGLTNQKVELGKLTGPVKVTAKGADGEPRESTLYPSSVTGYGVISDIDDTVKISHVLEKAKVAETTLIDDPKAVPGMPALYASLTKTLSSPLFVYISGSPFQLYPFLNKFIESSYSASKGPIILQNIAPGDFSWLKSDATAIQKYKTKTFEDVLKMYPQKKFMLIGDSGQRDPETYGDIARKNKSNVMCIWIRRVDDDGADNSEGRFKKAFSGVSSTMTRVFKDSETSGLQKIDVKGGKC